MKQEAVIRISEEESDPCTIDRGVRQGCSLSPLLFSIDAEKMLVEGLDDANEGVNVGGELLKDIRFADDQAMVAETEKGLQNIMDGLNEASHKYGIKINVEKKKAMVISRKGGGTINITLNGERIEQVSKFCYLGSWITHDERYNVEIRPRIAMAKATFSKRKELLIKNMSRNVKKKMIKAVIWSVLLYGSET